MTTKLGGRALATKLISDDELTTYKLEGGFVATPVYGVAESSPTEGGNLLPVYVIDDADLKQNGGRYSLAKGTPLPINTYITNRDVVRGRALPVYVVGGSVNTANSAITGSLAATLGAMTLSATGTVQLQGVLATTLDPLTLSAAGTVTDNTPGVLNFRQISSNSGSTGAGGTLAVNKPTGTLNGDMMLMMASTSSTTAHTPPAGWDLVTTVDLSAGEGGSGNKISVYKRIASSEGSSYTFTTGAFANLTLAIIAWYSTTGRTITVDAFDEGTNASGTSHVAPSVTTTIANAMLHCFYTFSGTLAGSVHGGMDERLDTTVGGSGYIMTGNVAATGATGTRTMTSTNSATSAAITVAIAEVV